MIITIDEVYSHTNDNTVIGEFFKYPRGNPIEALNKIQNGDLLIAKLWVCLVGLWAYDGIS